MTKESNQGEVVGDHFADSSPPKITATEGKENGLSVSKQFRCQKVSLYDRNDDKNSMSSRRGINGDGNLQMSELSLIPTWNSGIARRLQKLKKTEKTKCARREENQGRDDKVTNRRESEGEFRPEAKALTKESIEAPDYPFEGMPLIPSGRDQFAIKLKRLNVASSIVHQQADCQSQDFTDDTDDSSVASTVKSLEDVTEELSTQEAEKPQVEIPKISPPIIMEIIGSYVNDRTVWNSLSSLNKETFFISKNLEHIYRPWPSIRWRVTTTTTKGVPGQGLLQQQRPRRRNARGAVQTSARPRTVAFGKDYLCCGTDQGDVHLRSVHGDGSIKVRRGHSGCLNSVKCCGNWLVSAGDDLETRIWNVATMSCEAILDDHLDSITSIAILPLENFRHHNDCPSSSSSSCMLIATAGLDGEIHMYAVYCEGNKVVCTEHLATFAEGIQPKPIYSIVLYEKDGRRSLISGGMDSQLRLWDVDTAIDGVIGSCYNEAEDNHNNSPAKKIYRNTSIYRYDGEIKSIVISRDKERIAAAFGRTICHSRLSSKTLQSYNFLHHHDHNHRRRRRLEQQRRLQSQGQNSPERVSLSGMNIVNDAEDDHWKVLKGHSGDIRCIDFSRDGTTIASACSDGSIRLWQLGQGTWKRKWKAHNGFMVCSLAVSPDGQSLLSAGSDGTIVIEDLFP